MAPALLSAIPGRRYPCRRAPDDAQEYSAPRSCNKASRFPALAPPKIQWRRKYFRFPQTPGGSNDATRLAESLRVGKGRRGLVRASTLRSELRPPVGVPRVAPRRISLSRLAPGRPSVSRPPRTALTNCL